VKGKPSQIVFTGLSAFLHPKTLHTKNTKKGLYLHQKRTKKGSKLQHLSVIMQKKHWSINGEKGNKKDILERKQRKHYILHCKYFAERG
jgi:hypothetical protein